VLVLRTLLSVVQSISCCRLDGTSYSRPIRSLHIFSITTELNRIDNGSSFVCIEGVQKLRYRYIGFFHYSDSTFNYLKDSDNYM
jgi:hypothetical protein